MSKLLKEYFKNQEIIHISVKGKYTEDISVNIREIQENITQSNAINHIVFVVDTLSCDIKAAFELTDWLLGNNYSWDTVISGFSGSFGTVLSFGAQTIYLGTASFFMPIDATHPSHNYPLVGELLNNSHHIRRNFNPEEINCLKNFMEDVFKSKNIPTALIARIREFTPDYAVFFAPQTTRDIIIKLMYLSKCKSGKATIGFISNLTVSCGSFDFFVNGKDFSSSGSNIVLIPSEVQREIEKDKPALDLLNDLFQNLEDKDKEELFSNISYLSSIRNSLVIPIPSTVPFSFDLVCKIRAFISQQLGTNQETRKRITVLLDSLGGNEPSAFLMARVIKEFDTDFKVIVNRNARSAASLFVIGAPEILVRNFSIFSYYDPSVEDMNFPGNLISESALRRVFLSPNLSDTQKEDLFKELFLHYSPLRLGQVFRAGEALRRFTTYFLKEKGVENAEDIAGILTFNPYPHEYPLSIEEFSRISNLELTLLDDQSDNIMSLISPYL